MELPKYARWEHERRFLVRPEDARLVVDGAHQRLVEDRYLSCGRLRLRKLTDAGTGAVTLKLTKKYPPASDLSQPIVTVLLSPEEYVALCALRGADLRKRRHHVDVGALRFGVDVFEGPLAGLVLASIEADTLEALERIAPPPWAGPDVTRDPFFCGGRLAVATVDELRHACGWRA